MCSHAGVEADAECSGNKERGPEMARGTGMWSWVLEDEQVLFTRKEWPRAFQTEGMS